MEKKFCKNCKHHKKEIVIDCSDPYSLLPKIKLESNCYRQKDEDSFVDLVTGKNTGFVPLRCKEERQVESIYNSCGKNGQFFENRITWMEKLKWFIEKTEAKR